jgi:hypothetical protein
LHPRRRTYLVVDQWQTEDISQKENSLGLVSSLLGLGDVNLDAVDLSDLTKAAKMFVSGVVFGNRSVQLNVETFNSLVLPEYPPR